MINSDLNLKRKLNSQVKVNKNYSDWYKRYRQDKAENQPKGLHVDKMVIGEKVATKAMAKGYIRRDGYLGQTWWESQPNPNFPTYKARYKALPDEMKKAATAYRKGNGTQLNEFLQAAKEGSDKETIDLINSFKEVVFAQKAHNLTPSFSFSGTRKGKITRDRRGEYFSFEGRPHIRYPIKDNQAAEQ